MPAELTESISWEAVLWVEISRNSPKYKYIRILDRPSQDRSMIAELARPYLRPRPWLPDWPYFKEMRRDQGGINRGKWRLGSRRSWKRPSSHGSAGALDSRK